MIVASALLCHAPIVIPLLAGTRAQEVKSHTASMRASARWLVEAVPETIVLLSPQAPRLAESFSVASGAEFSGSFQEFGHPELMLRFPNASTLAGALCAEIAEPELSILPISHSAVDYGSLVPLYFLWEAGWRGPICILGFPHLPTHDQCGRLGSKIAEVCQGVGQRTALVASADLTDPISFCTSLSASGPFTANLQWPFDKGGAVFDRYLIQYVSAGALNPGRARPA